MKNKPWAIVVKNKLNNCLNASFSFNLKAKKLSIKDNFENSKVKNQKYIEITKILFILCAVSFCFQSCNKQTLNGSSLNVALDLRSLEYAVLQTPGNSIEITDLGIAGLYVTRVDLINFTVYDLFNPNVNQNGDNCPLELLAANQSLTDRCNNIVYSTMTNNVINPTNNTVIAKTLISYPYVYISEIDREILYIQ